MIPRLGTVVEAYDFELDDFQRRAIAALDAGQSVLVAAPTGSGKTVVAEHAVADALAHGGKAFYTTPIKALSNQKFGDLVRRHGPGRVGLLTGDNAINGDAPVVVMTTEVLRNMIYSSSPALEGLRDVILDEVHYLHDAYRGPVWEEVIVHLAPAVRLVCLSATVTNADELAAWISTVRGATAAIIEEHRPVELENLYLVGDRDNDRLHLLPTLVDGHPNPVALRLDTDAVRGPRGGRGGRRPGRRLYTPRRIEVAERLAAEGMLPAIYFLFSRAGCDEAVRHCLEGGVRFTDEEERDRIRAVCEEHAASMSDADLEVLGWARWLAGMEAGIAAHHAGMVPPFKEAVEVCFGAGLVRLVFATETLALGINMPARAVVIERLTKFTGERHQHLTAGEHTQLTGRAGRRGLDEVGFGVVLWSPFVTFEQVAALVTTRTHPISSSFRPTYNMAANLVRRYPAGEAHHLLNRSFAQFQADREVVGLEARLEHVDHRLGARRAEVSCDRGDVEELLEHEGRLAAARGARPSPRRQIHDALARFRPGDVVRAPRSAGPAVVVSSTQRRGSPRLRVLTARRRRFTLGPADFDVAPDRLGHIELPLPYAPNTARFQREVAAALARSRLDRRPWGPGDAHADPELDQLAASVAGHPCAGCPELGRHRRAAAQVERLERERAGLLRQVQGRSASLARQFDVVLSVLADRGYLDGWALTDAGQRLARTYHEADLLICECLGEGVLDGLGPAEVAGLASVFTYEMRGPGQPPEPWFPSPELRRRWATVEALHAGLVNAEEAAGLPTTRAPDPGFVALAHAWAAGEGLVEVLGDEDLSGGDFVRNVKQLIDLVRQLSDVASEPATATAARAAADALFRGVIAASSAVTAGGGGGP
ncbi:MAG: DEAD/DEAH box helicase [Acidimicrobiales bacterium]